MKIHSTACAAKTSNCLIDTVKRHTWGIAEEESAELTILTTSAISNCLIEAMRFHAWRKWVESGVLSGLHVVRDDLAGKRGLSYPVRAIHNHRFGPTNNSGIRVHADMEGHTHVLSSIKVRCRVLCLFL